MKNQSAPLIDSGQELGSSQKENFANLDSLRLILQAFSSSVSIDGAILMANSQQDLLNLIHREIVDLVVLDMLRLNRDLAVSKIN